MVPLDDPAARAAYEDEPLPRMSIGDHLDELRSRLIKALLAVTVAILGVLPFKAQVQEIILLPYHVQWRAGFLQWMATLVAREASGDLKDDPIGAGFLAFCRQHEAAILAGETKYPYLLPQLTGYPVPYNLFAINGLEDIMSFMWASLVFGLVLAAPVVVWQAWAFVAAGLYQRERAVFYRYFPFMMALLVAGVLFGYFVALPFSLGFLLGIMDPTMVTAMLSVGQFLTLLFAMTGAMGLVFQLPLVMVALQRVGLVTHRGFVKHWRMTVLVLFVAAAVFTPPDPMSMTLMVVPMLVLYAVGLLLTRAGRAREAGPAVEVA